MIDVVSLALSKNYTDKEITKAATSLSFKQKIVESLPSSGEIHTIYFIKNNSSWKDNYYDEYLWIPDTNSFEKIGSTEIPGNFVEYDESQDIVEMLAESEIVDPISNTNNELFIENSNIIYTL